jgi:hypothetical protein
MATKPDPFTLTADQIYAVLRTGRSLFPELEQAKLSPTALLSLPSTHAVLATSAEKFAQAATIPQTTYTKFGLFVLTGDRQQYEEPYFAKRARLFSAGLRLFLGQSDLRDTVQDYIWSVCDEETWVLPAHIGSPIDLFSAETGYNLAELLVLLGDTLDGAVTTRVLREIERRIFQPYIEYHWTHWWWKGHNNWNGVCNSSVACTFLLLDPSRRRAAQAVAVALDGLHTFLDTAFEEDGASSEGVGYWGYGLANFIPLSEMLYSASAGDINLLGTKRLKQIAPYPSRVMLSAGCFAPFSDAHEETTFNEGNVSRLELRTGERSLRNLLLVAPHEGGWWISAMLRRMLWWDGSRPSAVTISDELLTSGAIARLTATTPDGAPVVVVIKGGHNDVSHNHNDIGSFIVHVDGESLLSDPEAGLYTRQYFSPARYENIFTNSYGHSVPRIGGQLQPAGRQYEGSIAMDTSGTDKGAVVEFARAYGVPTLTGARRHLTLHAAGNDTGVVILEDHFTFAGSGEEIEEAFATWCDVDIANSGRSAVIHGQRHSLRLTIESPAGGAFALQRLEKESIENQKPHVLKRLTFVLPPASSQTARVRMVVEKPRG